MSCDQSTEMQDPSVDTNKLSYEIFSILESKFLFGYGDDPKKLWIPKKIEPPCRNTTQEVVSYPPTAVDDINNNNNNGGVTAIKNQRGKICVLSIDGGGGGGGMRGIFPGKALAHLERALKTKSGDPDARIADYFDVAAGTGVGGIFTTMLFATTDHRRPIFHADDTWRFLAQQGGRFFRPSSTAGGGFLRRLFAAGGRCPNSRLEKAVRDAFTVTDKGGGSEARSLTLKDTLKPVLIPCYDLSSSAPFLFSRADALETDSFDFRLWEVCRATSAEPGLFEPVQMRSADGQTRVVAVDGGLAMSNPGAAAITHVLHNKQEFPHVRGVEDILILSLGTGQLLEEDQASCDYEQVKGWRAKDWARPAARISGDAAAELVDQAVAMAYGPGRDRKYVRIQGNGSSLGWCKANVDTDPSPSNVNVLVGVAEEMLKQKNVESVLLGGKRIGEQSNLEKLDWFAGELVQEHQRRSCRIAPTVAFKQANPKPT